MWPTQASDWVFGARFQSFLLNSTAVLKISLALSNCRIVQQQFTQSCVSHQKTQGWIGHGSWAKTLPARKVRQANTAVDAELCGSCTAHSEESPGPELFAKPFGVASVECAESPSPSEWGPKANLLNEVVWFHQYLVRQHKGPLFYWKGITETKNNFIYFYHLFPKEWSFNTKNEKGHYLRVRNNFLLWITSASQEIIILSLFSPLDTNQWKPQHGPAHTVFWRTWGSCWCRAKGWLRLVWPEIIEFNQRWDWMIILCRDSLLC